MPVDIVNLQRTMRVPRAAIRRALAVVMREDLGREVRVSLAVVTDRRIEELNRAWLSHEGPTDVITYELADAADGPGPSGPRSASGSRGPAAADDVFGEIVISADRALEEAKRRGLDPARELVLYAVHGMLHLSGYDDLTTADARRMHRRETAVLRTLDGDTD